MSRIVVTGFEPFGEWPVNPSGEAVWLLEGVSAHVLPVDHELAAETVRGIVRREQPDVILLTGLAAGSCFRLETVARGPERGLRRGRWPFAAAQARLAGRGLPCRLSRDAGRYVCETSYFAALGTGVPRVAFLHVPPLGGVWTARRIARAMALCLGAVSPARPG